MRLDCHPYGILEKKTWVSVSTFIPMIAKGAHSWAENSRFHTTIGILIHTGSVSFMLSIPFSSIIPPGDHSVTTLALDFRRSSNLCFLVPHLPLPVKLWSSRACGCSSSTDVYPSSLSHSLICTVHSFTDFSCF